LPRKQRKTLGKEVEGGAGGAGVGGGGGGAAEEEIYLTQKHDNRRNIHNTSSNRARLPEILKLNKTIRK